MNDVLNDFSEFSQNSYRKLPLFLWTFFEVFFSTFSQGIILKPLLKNLPKNPIQIFFSYQTKKKLFLISSKYILMDSCEDSSRNSTNANSRPLFAYFSRIFSGIATRTRNLKARFFVAIYSRYFLVIQGKKNQIHFIQSISIGSIS